ncbi:MAG: DUF4193 family protein [Actinomycetota bacterium]|nr:DUF4193 family protein [Actinomycetota bacterium]
MYADHGKQEQVDEATAGPGNGSVDAAEDALAEVNPIPSEGDEEDEETSLEVLVARRAASWSAGEEIEDDPDELVQLLPQRPARAGDPAPRKVVAIRERREFVCNRCHLVKARSQLADHERGLCRDCV